MKKITLDENWIRESAWDLPTTLNGLFTVAGTATDQQKVEWLKYFLARPAAKAMPSSLREEVTKFLAKQQKKSKNATSHRINVKAAGVPRKFEPYDPDAEDGDGDGLVQDGTPWERPGGTRIVDRAGNEIERGLNVETRPTGVRIVDADGNEVDYTPSWAGGTGDSIANIVEARPPEILNQPAEGTTPLSDHGAATLKERGLPTVREAANPNPPEPKKPKEPKESKTPEKPEAKEPKKSSEPIDARFDEGLPGEYRITYGDREFTVVDERDSDDIASDAFNEWGEFDGNYRMRHASAALMGIAPPPADGAKQGDRKANEIVASGKWPDANPESTATAEMSVLHASALMSVIARGDEVTDTEVFRGLAVAPDDRLLRVEEGETLSMPISAFATEIKMARNFTTAPDGDRRTVPLVLELESGAQIYGEDSEPQLLQGADGEWFEANEVLTHGDFEVVGTREEGDVRVVTVRQVATYRPSGQKVQVGSPSRRPSTSKEVQPKYARRNDPKQIVDAVLEDLDELVKALPSVGDVKDEALARILKSQGFDGPPQQVQFPGDLPESLPKFYRGVGRSTHSIDEAAAEAEQFRTGDLFPGRGPQGGGTYLTTDRFDATYYGHPDDPLGERTVVDMAIDESAYMPWHSDVVGLVEDTKAEIEKRIDEAEKAEDAASVNRLRNALKVVDDPGRVAALLGADGYRLSGVQPLGGVPRQHLVLLNRTKAIVARKPTPRKKAEAESPMAAVGRPLGYIPGVPNLETQRGREIAGKVETARRENIERFTEEARDRILEVLDEVGISVEFDWGTGEYSADELIPLLDRAGLDVDDFISAAIETADAELRETIEFLRQRDMLVALKESALQGLLSDGRYKSQHETNSSMGSLNPARRIRIEEEQLGVPSEIADTLRPVYGFLDDDSGEFPNDQFAPFAYGADFVLELKPELKERSTLTFGDSLDHGGVGVPMSSNRELEPGDGMAAAGQVTQEEAIQNAIQNAIIIELRKAAESAEEATAAEQPQLFTDEEMGAAPRSGLRTIADDIEQMLWENPSFERWYDEIQVHGGFTTDDVVTIWTSTDEQGIPEELLDLAREQGITFKNQYGDEFP